MIDKIQEEEMSTDEILAVINKHITSNPGSYIYQKYNDEILNRRGSNRIYHNKKNPLIGKQMLTVDTGDDITLKLFFLPEMICDILYEINLYNKKISGLLLVACKCVHCNGFDNCEYQQYMYINDGIDVFCRHPCIEIKNVKQQDIDDIRRIIDKQIFYLTKNFKELKSGGDRLSAEKNISEIDEIMLDSQPLNASDTLKIPKKLIKYADRNHLILLGENKGLWFYYDYNFLGANNFDTIPAGNYLHAYISDTLIFPFAYFNNFINRIIYENSLNVSPVRFLKINHIGDIYYTDIFITL
jgi:hypothetical protein